jgi:isoleucyl-tRNA synthetase
MAKDNGGTNAIKAKKAAGAAAPAAASDRAPVQAEAAIPAGSEGRDWSKTLFLPQTDFPMRAGLPDL